MNNLTVEIKNMPLISKQSGIWYLGQEGFLIKNGEEYILTDPYLTDYVDKHCSDTAKWKRLYPPPVSPTELDFINVVLCSHVHYDHADPDTLYAIACSSGRAVFIVPAPEVDLIASYGIEHSRIIPAIADSPIVIGGTTVIPVPAAHEELHINEKGEFSELGYIIENESGKFFHAGDMCMYDGLSERLNDIDIAFLPINGRDYYRNSLDIIGNFTCEEAVLLSKEIGAGMLVPMHWDLYEINRVSPSIFVNVLERLNKNQRYHLFAPGEKYIFTK